MGVRPRASRLDAEFAARRLARTGTAARLLHITPQLLACRVADGVVKRERFELAGGHRYNGIAYDEVSRMHQSMWPYCPHPGCASALAELEGGAPC